MESKFMNDIFYALSRNSIGFIIKFPFIAKNFNLPPPDYQLEKNWKMAYKSINATLLSIQNY